MQSKNQEHALSPIGNAASPNVFELNGHAVEKYFKDESDKLHLDYKTMTNDL